MSKFPRLMFATAVVAACAVFVSSSASAQTTWTTPGDPSEKRTSVDNNKSSCSLSVTRAAGEYVQTGQTVKFFGVCNWNAANVNDCCSIGKWLAGGRSLADINELRINAAANGSGGIYYLAYKPSGSPQYPNITAFESAPCPNIPGCATWSLTSTGTATSPTVGNYSRVPPASVAMNVELEFHSAGCGGFCRSLSPNSGVVYGQPTFGEPYAPRYYWGSAAPYAPGPPPPVPCGTDATGPLYTGGTAPVPDVPTSSLNLARTGVVQPGSGVRVTYPKPIAEGQVFAKWADEPDTKYRALVGSETAQSLYLVRPATATGPQLERDVVFKCVRPANSTPLYSQFVQAQNGDGAGAWAVFTTSDTSRVCAMLTINSLPRAGYVPGTQTVPLYVVSSVARAVGDVVISYEWSGDSAVFPSQAFTPTNPVTFTIPAASTLPDRYYERLRVICTDSVGKFTMRGDMATNDVDPMSTDPFPGEQDLDLCFSNSGIGFNPESWVPAGARMGSCVLRVLFIPGSMDIEALRRRVTGAAGVWAEPITALTSGISTLVGTSGSCSYTASLPINGGLDMTFDSCSGHVKTGRELVYAASSVSIALFGGLYLKRKAVSILTMNSQEAASNAAYVEASRAKSGGKS